MYCMTTTFVLFGATGDLVRKKVLPALDTLGKDNRVIAVGRRAWQTAEYVTFLDYTVSVPLQYLALDVSVEEQFRKLDTLLADTSNVVFYLATSHALFDRIIKGLQHLSPTLLKHCKIVFEKPFGESRESAQALDRTIKTVFREEQIYRIDHYLAKERVHALLERKKEMAFEEKLTKEHVAKIEIVAHESAGVGERLSYYHEAGALKDMVQNHLLQVLSLVLLDMPERENATNIHTAKDMVLVALRVDIENCRIGQYKSYGAEAHRAGLQKRKTETFARVQLSCALERWRGVQIVVETGKKLAERHAFVRITFIDGSHELFEINPLGFTKHEDGYLFLCEELLKGNQEWFARSDEILESWRIVDELEAVRETLPFIVYKDGNVPTY